MFRRAISLFVVFAFAIVPLHAETASKKSTSAKSSSSSKSKDAPAKAKPAPAKSAGIAEPFPVDKDGAAPVVTAGAYIVLDANSGRVLTEHNADSTRPVASTQKLLTGLIVAEDGDLDKMVRVQATDTDAEPTKLNFKPGETYSRYRLLEVFLIHSMNDVARALARDNAGSISAFADRMNAKARILGMRNSNFVNPNGLPAEGQYSTARDMSKVAMAAYRNRLIRGIVNQKYCTWTYNSGRTVTFTTTNVVLKNYALCNGMKTGYTEAAGRCLISSASYGGKDVICVILGDTKKIWNDSYRLLNWALSS